MPTPNLRPLAAVVEAQSRPAPTRRGAPPLRCALVGFGRRGLELARAAAGVPQLQIVAVADAYEGRLERAREVLGASIFTAREGAAAIRHSDAEAVLIATPDHLHAAQIRAALDATRPLYCEHPVVHARQDLAPVRRALVDAKVTAGDGVLPPAIVGAAREIVREGRLGELTLVSGSWDTGTALDAWVVPFPPDTSSDSIDWNAFAPSVPDFNPAHFFRWPVFSRYGSGLIGTRFVPQLWDIHRILDLPAPDRCTAAGRLARWQDGRDTPDLLHATFDYPDLVVDLNATLNGSGRAREVRLIGTDATLVLGDDRLAIIPQQTAEPFAELGNTWPETHRRWVFMMHGLTPDGAPRGMPPVDKTAEEYRLPRVGHDLTPSLAAFVEAVRSGKPPAGTRPASAADVAGAGVMCARALEAGRTVTRQEALGESA